MTRTRPTSPQALTGTRIRERRLAMSRRQADVARAAGISPAYLNLIEHNRRPVGEALIARLAEALDVPADELESGREEARIAALREVAGRLRDSDLGAELDQIPEFVARYPGWAGALIAVSRQAEGMEHRLISLSERLGHDPYLLATLHEVLSAVTSLRSTASILAGDKGISAEWQDRFHNILDEESQRLSATAQALVAYLDTFETESAAMTPQDEVEAWMAAGAPPLDEAADLASDAARSMAAGHIQRMDQERALLPDDRLSAAAGMMAQRGGAVDAAALAGDLALPLDLVMRRLAVLRPEGFRQAGLLVCDGAGVPVLRRPTAGFSLPRWGDACALWPVFQALSQPQVASRIVIEMPDRQLFDTLSYAVRSQPLGAGGPVLTHAHMLILPITADPQMAQAIRPVGLSCRICPRADCPARREPSILAPD